MLLALLSICIIFSIIKHLKNYLLVIDGKSSDLHSNAISWAYAFHLPVLWNDWCLWLQNSSQIDSVKGEIYVAFNTSHLPAIISLPKRPGYRWEPLVDTSKPEPFDFLTGDLPEKEIAIKQYAPFLDSNLYPMLSYSSIILLLSSDENV